MDIFVCLYDEPQDYDSDVSYDGFCEEEATPELPVFINVGRSSRKKHTTEQHCYFEFNITELYIDGILIRDKFKKIKYKCSTTNKIQLVVNEIYVANDKFDDMFQCNINGIYQKNNHVEILTEALSITNNSDDIRITVHSVIKKYE
jgi:hypothetical protein